MPEAKSTTLIKDYSKSAHIDVLMIDDQAMVGVAMERMLEDEKDIQFHFLSDPTRAMEVALDIRPTVILQDLVMPDVDGLTLVKCFRANERTKHIPMIVLSSKEDAEIKQKAFENGANDYMVKFPHKLEVLARIRYHSQAYTNYLERIKNEKALRDELDQAEKYMRSLLPEKVDLPELKTDWAFISSTVLAGDAFGYHWIDDKHFAIYLLDVCGHGVGSALLSVSVMNVMRSESLKNVDFRDPAAVLAGLNEAFDMDKHNDMYFTMWYGVFNREASTLNYSSGGHPPAILIDDNDRGDASIKHLSEGGMIVGAMQGVSFDKEQVAIKSGSRLYVFSDGVYEVDASDGSRMMSADEFAEALIDRACEPVSKVKSMVDFSRTFQGRDAFEDDYSLIEIVFK